MIAYTSGSTGLPKGAIYPHDKFLRTILYTALCATLPSAPRTTVEQKQCSRSVHAERILRAKDRPS
jgi:long-subunit acyl-CoA synthetase (AMP-forming)